MELKNELQNMWKPESKWQLIPMSKGFYTIKFTTAEDKNCAKRSNMWNLNSGTMRLREWVRNFDPYKEISSLCQVWVRIYYLPVEYWTKEIISSIGRSVGMPIKVDGATVDGDFAHFARVLVEVDLALPLPESAAIECPDRTFHCKKKNSNTKGKGPEVDRNKEVEGVSKDAAKDAEKNSGAEFSVVKSKSTWAAKPMVERDDRGKVESVNRFNALSNMIENVEEMSGPDLLEAVTIPVTEKNVDAGRNVDSEEEDVEQIEAESIPIPTQNVEIVDMAFDKQQNSKSSVEVQEREAVETTKGLDHRDNRDEVKEKQPMQPAKKRGRPPGQVNKETRIIPGADSIKGRLRKASDSRCDPNPEAVECIKEKLYKAWEECGNPRDFVITNNSSESARVMSKIGAKSWAEEVEMGIIEPKVAFLKTPIGLWKSLNVVIVDYLWRSRQFRVAIVHGSSSHLERRSIWIDILPHVASCYVVMGDFNAVKGAHERSSNCRLNAASCGEFCEFIDALGCIESPTVGLKFTWSGRRFMPSHVESLLDKVFFSDLFAAGWHSVFTQVLPRVTSDHSPIILNCQLAPIVTRQFFRFFDIWTLHPNFMALVKESWSRDIDTSCPIYRVMAKLKRLKKDLRVWNKNTFGNVDKLIMEKQQELLEIQDCIAVEGYTEELFEKEVTAQANINMALSRKNKLLHQKSRVTWLQDGDRNSAFFHSMLKYKRRPHIISHLVIDGETCVDQGAIGNHIVGFFTSLFTEPDPSSVDIVNVEAVMDHIIPDHANDLLSRIPREEEITAAVFQMDSHSSPGPDGFSGKFYHSCWDIIKTDIWRAVITFFTNSYLPNGCNSNTLILIPKKETVSTVADLRPIVFSNFLFKIISKVLVVRLSTVAAQVVSNNQFGFISGRSIHDCIMLGSEGFNCLRRSCGGQNMACKVDITKAFDTLRWDFLINVMKVCGYNHRFIRWIESGHLIPMQFCRGTLFPTHLLYADDILIFCKATQSNARTLHKILDFYGFISGQVFSPEKSHLYFSEKVASPVKRQITRILPISEGSLPFTYLGVPIFRGKPKASHLRAILDRIINKFARWKGV
ncbi:uncharacterized protein LOC131023456 [Salvia miltiorrhiza]|uniref:uncharacterized protein LOC131023456 n=1 Tax=Salvia miltiorrhiza TaxID=226208 RepID=UPI0025AD76CC|nr:uncharacterized protein LOC131023456 [Salvia miltiorrhiza]